MVWWEWMNNNSIAMWSRNVWSENRKELKSHWGHCSWHHQPFRNASKWNFLCREWNLHSEHGTFQAGRIFRVGCGAWTSSSSVLFPFGFLFFPSSEQSPLLPSFPLSCSCVDRNMNDFILLLSSHFESSFPSCFALLHFSSSDRTSIHFCSVSTHRTTFFFLLHLFYNTPQLVESCLQNKRNWEWMHRLKENKINSFIHSSIPS